MNTRITLLAAVSGVGLILAACGDNEPATTPAEPMPMDSAAQAPAATGTVVETASSSPDYSTLTQAITTAGLADTLNGAGPFTVFAPSNAAFEQVDQATRDRLMSEAGRTDLTNILTYHVVPGRLMAADLASQIQAGGGSATLTTVQGETLTARASGSSVTLTDGAGNTINVVSADMPASNGVIHGVDRVAMPG